MIEYRIQKGDTLENIAEKHNITIEELIEYHNSNCGITQRIDRDKLPLWVKIILIKDNGQNFKEEKLKLELEQEIKYRCEQKVFTYINGIPISNAVTKRDFLAETKIIEGERYVKIKLLDNIFTVNPENYKEAAEIVGQMDLIKCDNVILQLDKNDGSISRIVNHNEIIEKWEKKKKEMLQIKRKLKNKKVEKDLEDYISLLNKQFLDEDALIEDYKTKMFFDIYFNKYLIDSPDKLEPFETYFRSQLFDGQKTKIKINQDVIKESKDKFLVRKVSEVLENNDAKAKEIYDERIKPFVEYKFSEYKVSYRERSVYNDYTNHLEESSITIMEQVVNNIEVKIQYTVRKIE